MNELEKKQLLVDLIKTAAGEYYENDSYKTLNANDSTFSGLKEQLDFLFKNRLQLSVDDERTGNAEAPSPEETYTKADLVSFGNYLLSQERENMVSEINKREVTHADLENWRDSVVNG